MSTTTIPTDNSDLLARVNALVTGPCFGIAVNPGYHRSFIERVAAEAEKCTFDAGQLGKALATCEGIVTRFTGKRANLAERVTDLIGRHWFGKYQQQHPDVIIEMPAPDCSQETYEAIAAQVDAAFAWNEEKFIASLVKSVGTANSTHAAELEEFKYVNADAYDLIKAGYSEKLDRKGITALRKALDAFYGWLRGSTTGSGENTLKEMGLNRPSRDHDRRNARKGAGARSRKGGRHLTAA